MCGSILPIPTYIHLHAHIKKVSYIHDNTHTEREKHTYVIHIHTQANVPRQLGGVRFEEGGGLGVVVQDLYHVPHRPLPPHCCLFVCGCGCESGCCQGWWMG